MSELLLELFCEEIPARMQARAAEDLQRLVGEGLAAAGLTFDNPRAFSGPRRLTLVMDGLPKRSPDREEERKGPRLGAPDKAVEGFLRAAGLTSLAEAEIVKDAKGRDYYAARLKHPGRPTGDVVAEIVPDVIRSFPWPKSMRWGAGRLRWVRPLHSILCLLDGKPVAFEVDGIASGKRTHGHRFMAPKPFVVRNFADYARKLAEARVRLDAAERRAVILEGARALAVQHKLVLVEDEALLRENAGLTEWPVPLIGEFDPAYLDVPPEVLSTAMKAHQKCFSLQEARSSAGATGTRQEARSAAGATGKTQERLANRFILVANLEAEDGGEAIAAGNARVINARLADAKFFWDQDRKVSLQDRVEKLRGIVFHDKLGTQYDRVQRLDRLARELAPLVGADADEAERAAILAKADLVTGMVGEFPELQGIMGRYYALEEGELPEVADAIAEHYRPQGPGDAVPTHPVSIAAALADKLDMLVGFWAIDEKPTGSKDPYALRRAALGVIRIVLENGLRLSLLGIAYEMHQQYLQLTIERDDARKDVDYIVRIFSPFRAAIGHKGGREHLADWANIIQSEAIYASYFISVRELLGFFADRLKVYLRDQGARYDLIDAVFALEGQDDLLMIVRRVEALGRFLETEDGEHLLTGVKRAINILRIEEKKDGRQYDAAPEPGLLTQKEEQALADAIDAAEAEAARAVAAEDFEAAMGAIAALRAPVDAFFDHVTVNADDADLRANRLRLLNRIRAATLPVADFSKISG